MSQRVARGQVVKGSNGPAPEPAVGPDAGAPKESGNGRVEGLLYKVCVGVRARGRPCRSCRSGAKGLYMDREAKGGGGFDRSGEESWSGRTAVCVERGRAFSERERGREGGREGGRE